MRQELLDSVTRREGLYLFWCQGEKPSSQWFHDLGASLSGEAPSVLVDLTRSIPLDQPGAPCLLDVRLHQGHPDQSDDRTIPWSDKVHVLPTGIHLFPDALDPARLRNFLVNLSLVREQFSSMLILLPSEWKDSCSSLLANASVFVVCQHEVGQGIGINDLPVQELKSLPQLIVLDKKASQKIPRRWRLSLYPTPPMGGDPFPEPAKLAASLLDARRCHVLAKNPPDSWIPMFHRFWWIGALLLSLLVFVFPLRLDSPISFGRDLEAQKKLFSGKPFLQVRFDGNVTAQRMARHSIGRYTALVSSESEIRDYLLETISKNRLDTASWGRKEGGILIPPKETIIRFYPPDRLFNPKADSLMPAWKFFVSLLSDTAGYVTEYYNETGMGGRRHMGIDVAGIQGTRILAPFSGKAWTTEDDRGGVMIALSNGTDILLFMHCDQLLYMDGQEVYVGDPLATVGMTGHTTGPHVHLVTGKVTAKGPLRAGPILYKTENPVRWYHDFSLRLREKD